MTRRTIATTWLAGLIVVLAGGAIAGIATLVWLAHVSTVTSNGSSYVADNFFWTTVGFWWAGGIVAIAGIVVQVAAWIGALVNSRRLADRTWFNVLLWFGIVGIVASPIFGLGAMVWWGVTIAYLIAGPDSTTAREPGTEPPAASPIKLAPTS